MFFVATILSSAALTSCTFTEKIYISEDGTGAYQMDMDLSEIMGFSKNLENNTETDEGTEKKALQKMDTTIQMSAFLELYKDSISRLSADEKAVLESMKDAKMQMYMDEAAGDFQVNFVYDFKTVNELQDMQNKVSKAYNMSSKKDQKFTSLSSNSFYYDKNSFKRIVIPNKISKKDQQELDKNMDEMAMFMMGSTYNLEYHFPNKIKTTTAKGATFSDDKKTLFISLPLDEVLGDESLLDFEVKF